MKERIEEKPCRNNRSGRETQIDVLESSLPFASGRQARGRVCKQPHRVFSAGVPSSAQSADSRSFHILSNSALGADPINLG